MPMEEQHDSSSSSSPFNNNSGDHFPSTPPSPNVSFKFTDDNKVVSPNRKNSSSPNKNTKIIELLPRTAPPRPSTPPLPNNNNNTDDIHPDRVINIPITDSPSMATNVSELSHNSSLRTPTNNTIGGSTNYNSKKPLNSKQQAAMNNFLTAKSKEDKAKAWEDLVHSLKQTNHHHRNNKNGGSVDSYNSRGSQQKQRKGIGSSGSVGSSGSNHSLGFIQFHPKPSSSSSSSVNGVGGSGGMSVTSGLTSAGTATDITQYYVGGRGGAGNNGGSEQQYDGGGAMTTTPPSVTGGDHKPPLFPVITTSSSSKVVLGVGGGGVDELISPLSDNEYYEDDYDDTPEQQQQEEEEENGVSRALLNVDDTEEELAVYEDEEEEDVSALKGVTLFDSLSSIHVHDDDNGDVEVPPPPPPPTVMPKLQPPMRDDNSHSVRDMIGRYEKKEVALLEEEESESWSPSMIRRKSDQLFSSPEQEQRKQYQFYPEGEQQGEEGGPDENQFSLEWQQQDVEPSPGANVPTTAAAAITTVAATEAPTQRPRKPKKKRFVGGGSGSKCSLEDQIRLVLGNNNNYNSHDEGHKGDNDASASDILRELNSSKEQQQQPLRSSPSVINRLPPASISFGSKSKQQQGGEQQRISKQSTVANGAKSKKTPALLAPSRRDLHSLRIRQMVSESTLANNDDDVGGSAAHVENTTIATVATASTTTTNTTRESSVVRPVRGGKGFFTRTGPSSNPSSSGLLYSSDMITRDDDTDNFEFYPGLQPNNGGRPTAPQEMYGSSPPRGGAVTPEKPGSPTNSLAESINELKASISELKNAGVGGVGKSTSTLVWNESTGRYVIRDVDDESFDDMVSKGPTVTQESDDDEEEEEEEQDSSYMFKMPNHITRGSILDDDVVDEAVRLAAMDGMSSASTSVGATSGDESLNNFLASPGEEEEEDAFFVVERSNQNTVDDKWRAFQQSSGNDAFQLNSWGNNNDDGFGDDFADDASFPSEVQWGANDWTDWEDGEAGKHFDKMNFVSPASVPSSNRQDPFNPFAQLVLQSLD